MEVPRPGKSPTDPERIFALLAGKRLYIETYGCAYNFGDTANLVEVLRHIGSSIVGSPDEADAVIVNTCTVVGPTERRMLRRLSLLRDKELYVTGCMPLVQREAIFSVCTPVVIPPGVIREAYLSVRTVAPGGIGIVQVAQGCLGRCTYCITRKARGPLVSFPEREIVEKTRAFVAAGAWCGLRAICTMKHVGLNVAADPLMTSAYTGVTGGFVILSADDPFAHSSQNEQDTRCYAHFARLPCLDPAGVQEAHDMIPAAFAISEEFSLPVLFRPTTRICHSKGDVGLGAVVPNTRKGEFHKDPRQYVVIPAHTRVLHKKLNEKQPALKKRLVELGLNHGDKETGCAGFPAG